MAGLGNVAGIAAPIAMAGLQFYQSYKAEESSKLNQLYDTTYKNTMNRRMVGMENEAKKAAYGMQIGQYNQQKALNAYAASRAHAANQRRLNEAFTAAAFQRGDLLEDLALAEGYNAAANEGGNRSFERAGALSTVGRFGRTQARIAQGLTSAMTESQVSRNDIALQQYGSDLSAFSSIAVPPLGSTASAIPTTPMNSGMMIGKGLMDAWSVGYGLTAPGQRFLGIRKPIG